MQQELNISQELEALNSSLPGTGKALPYVLPGGYFEDLPSRMLHKVRLLEEVKELAPALAEISKATPYQVPSGYFEELANRAVLFGSLQDARPDDELKVLSPLLAGISRKSPYSVPADYLENISTPLSKPGEINSIPLAEQRPAKVIGISRQSWFRYAAAAILTAFVVTISFLFLNRNEIDPDIKPTAWVEKKLKKVSTDEIDEFVDLVDDNVATANPSTPAEVKLLIQEVSREEIEDFLSEAALAEPGEDVEYLN